MPAPKFEVLLVYLAARAAEPSTWQGVAVLCSVLGSHHLASVPWEQASALGVVVSGALGILLPDVKPPSPQGATEHEKPQDPGS